MMSLPPPWRPFVLRTDGLVREFCLFAQQYQRSMDEPASHVARADRHCHRHHRTAVAPPDTKHSAAFRQTFANDQPSLLIRTQRSVAFYRLFANDHHAQAGEEGVWLYFPSQEGG